MYDFYCDPNADTQEPASVIEYPEYTYKGVAIPIECSLSVFSVEFYYHPM